MNDKIFDINAFVLRLNVRKLKLQLGVTEMLQKFFIIDMSYLFAVLFWGNLISFAFATIYFVRNKSASEQKLSFLIMAARLCHTFYYFVASGRGTLPDIISSSLGNIILLLGIFIEAQAMLRVVKEYTKIAGRILSVLFLISLLLFIGQEFAVHTGASRIAAASLGNVIIMSLPVYSMLRSRDSGPFVKSVSILYLIFLAMLLIRVYVYGFRNNDGNILSTNPVQSITFLAMLLQLIISLPTYALILNSYSNEALHLMATTDRLTGATNRHAFSDAAEAVFKNNKTKQTSLAMIFIDIDHFKTVNDKYGHSFGDTVLARTASIIDKCLRESDLSCRYGGEEFVVLLPRADEASARIVSQRIMDEVRSARFEEHPEFSFTISEGVFCKDLNNIQNVNTIINAADMAMYKAKQEGRNKIVFCE